MKIFSIHDLKMYTMIIERFPCSSHEPNQSSPRDDTALRRDIMRSTVPTVQANEITG
jgi:hypothetical protein